MTRDESRRALDELNASIATAVMLIRAQAGTLDRFFAEARSMESAGPILDPTLFSSSERRATEALLKPIYQAARELVRAYDAQTALGRAAVEKVGRR